jgi:hypothetical protein
VGVEVANAAGSMPEHSPVQPEVHAEDRGSTTSLGRADVAQKLESAFPEGVGFVPLPEMVADN